jgi:hypothetical protein
MLTFKKLRLILLNVWLPILISMSLIIGITPLTSNASISSPKSTKIQQKQEIEIIYEALADDIIQIFKWMETPGIAPVELAVKILGYEPDSRYVSNLSMSLDRYIEAYLVLDMKNIRNTRQILLSINIFMEDTLA